MEKRWKKIIAERASAIVVADELSEESAALLTEEMPPEEFISLLADAHNWMDAVSVLSNALPRREAVWWACVCARGMQGVVNDKGQQIALAAAEKWVYKPTDEHRTAAYQSIQNCDSGSGGMMCALAAAFSEVTIPMGGDLKIDVDPSVFPGLVFAIILMAADEGEGDHLNERLETFFQTGKEIACGRSGKKEA